MESKGFELFLTQNDSNCCIVCRIQTNEHILSLATIKYRKKKKKRRKDLKKMVVHQKTHSGKVVEFQINAMKESLAKLDV